MMAINNVKNKMGQKILLELDEELIIEDGGSWPS
jgi:hypothetical protein